MHRHEFSVGKFDVLADVSSEILAEEIPTHWIKRTRRIDEDFIERQFVWFAYRALRTDPLKLGAVAEGNKLYYLCAHGDDYAGVWQFNDIVPRSVANQLRIAYNARCTSALLDVCNPSKNALEYSPIPVVYARDRVLANGVHNIDALTLYTPQHSKFNPLNVRAFCDAVEKAEQDLTKISDGKIWVGLFVQEPNFHWDKVHKKIT